MHSWTSNCVVMNQIIGYSSPMSHEFNNISGDTSAYKTFKSVFRQSSLWHMRQYIAYKDPGGPSLNPQYKSNPCPMESRLFLRHQISAQPTDCSSDHFNWRQCSNYFSLPASSLSLTRLLCTGTVQKTSFIQLINLSKVTQRMPQHVTTMLSDAYLSGASETRDVFDFSLYLIIYLSTPFLRTNDDVYGLLHPLANEKIEKCNNTLLRSLTIQTGKEQQEQTLSELEIGQPCPLGSWGLPKHCCQHCCE